MLCDRRIAAGEHRELDMRPPLWKRAIINTTEKRRRFAHGNCLSSAICEVKTVLMALFPQRRLQIVV